RAGGKGEIIWDVDWTTYELSDGPRVMKLSITDNGDGMTGDEMVKYINQLSSSLSSQSMSGSYGVGAKIAAVTRNPLGVLYLSWKKGVGAHIHMLKHKETGQYGLKQWKRSDSTYGHYLPLADEVKPDIIQSHGTKVVLMGMAEDHKTIEAPPGTQIPSRWIAKYLNSRYFRFPPGIVVKAREGWDQPRSNKDTNLLRTLTGQEKYLDEHRVAKGNLALENATAHWWVLKDEHALTGFSGSLESSGHTAALYNDELYELTTGKTGTARLQQFGVTFGYRQVVIYIEPKDTDRSRLTTNTARTQLLVNNETLPWTEWAAQFREQLPKEIAELVAEKAAAAANTDHEKTIRERLKDIMSFLKLSKYRVTSDGDLNVDPDRLTRGGVSFDRDQPNNPSDRQKKSGTGGTVGNVYAVFERPDGVPGSKVKPDPYPKAVWVSVKNGTREHGDMEDRAGKYLSEQNTLLLNADFRVFSDMIQHFQKEFAEVPAILPVIEDTVHQWFEQALVETVMGVQTLMHSQQWSQADIDSALTPEALTSAVMQRYHVLNAVKKALGIKAGAQRVPA
ncbi:MAG TPA: hypothetical protein PKY96_10870, partial [Flavobacteriales bacterium]|nr:hypothetical protein [Flavobacteriales bacterium]